MRVIGVPSLKWKMQHELFFLSFYVYKATLWIFFHSRKFSLQSWHLQLNPITKWWFNKSCSTHYQRGLKPVWPAKMWTIHPIYHNNLLSTDEILLSSTQNNCLPHTSHKRISNTMHCKAPTLAFGRTLLHISISHLLIFHQHKRAFSET